MKDNIKCIYCGMTIDNDSIHDDVAVCLECGGIFNINNNKPTEL